MKKIITIAALSLLLFSCSGKNEKIRIGVLPVIDTLPLLVADEQGLFKSEGINVELITFNSALERDAALTSGNLDGAFGDLIAALLQIKNGIDAKIVIESSHTAKDSRMFALLASPASKIDSIKRIGSNEVAISMGSIIEFFLDRMMLSGNTDPAKVMRIEVKAIPVRLQMLMTNSLKLALIPEPLASKAIKDGAVLLADDTKLDTTATVIMFRESFLNSNRESMKKFIAAYNKSVIMINSEPSRFRELMVTKTRVPEDIKDTFKVPSFSSVKLPSEKDVMLVFDWMKGKEMISAPVDYRSITWSLQK